MDVANSNMLPTPYPISWRMMFYPRLAPIANHWNTAMGMAVQYPDKHADFLARCHAAGQIRPTPLLPGYGTDDYHCQHQHLYGAHVFPLQGAQGVYRVNLKHGVSRIRNGCRHTRGVIFDDAL